MTDHHGDLVAEEIQVNGLERQLQAEIRQLPEWGLANEASIGLAQALLALGPRTFMGPRHEGGPILQLYAQQIIGVRTFRAIRAAMAVLGAGYETETRALDRILVELIAHRETVQGDATGEEARLWLEGKRDRGIAAKVNAMQPADMYRNLCHDSHGDPRGAWRLVHPETGAIVIGPQRRPLAARASLLMYAGVACDQAGTIAALAEFQLLGRDELAQRVRDGWNALKDEGGE